MTYADAFKRVAKLANVLDGLNLQKGDVIAVMDWERIAFWKPIMRYLCHNMYYRP